MKVYRPIPEFREKDIKRFWTKVAKSEDINECWEWQANKDNNGYGRFNLFGELHTTHRLSYHLFNHIDITEKQVLHKCDNPKCVNPNHLFLGTAEDNMRDREIKGRANHPKGNIHWAKTKPEFLAKGERSGRNVHKDKYPIGARKFNAKLNDQKVREIRRIFAEEKPTHQFIADKFNVTSQLICLVVNNKIWTHVA